MPTRDRHPATTAMLDQLRAEISARQSSVKATATAMEIDYWTFRKYLNGEREMPLDVLTRALEVIDLDYATFAARAIARQGTPRAD